MPVSDVLQQIRSGKPMSEPGLQQPAFDPIQIIAGLLGPALMRGMMGAGAMGGAGAEAMEQAAPEGFSQADMLAARLRAGGRSARRAAMSTDSPVPPPDIAHLTDPYNLAGTNIPTDPIDFMVHPELDKTMPSEMARFYRLITKHPEISNSENLGEAMFANKEIENGPMLASRYKSYRAMGKSPDMAYIDASSSLNALEKEGVLHKIMERFRRAQNN